MVESHGENHPNDDGERHKNQQQLTLHVKNSPHYYYYKISKAQTAIKTHLSSTQSHIFQTKSILRTLETSVCN